MFQEIEPVSVNEIIKTDGAIGLELRVTNRNRLQDGYWNFLDKFGFHHDDNPFQSLHPLEVFPKNSFILTFVLNSHIHILCVSFSCFAITCGKSPVL